MPPFLQAFETKRKPGLHHIHNKLRQNIETWVTLTLMDASGSATTKPSEWIAPETKPGHGGLDETPVGKCSHLVSTRSF